MNDFIHLYQAPQPGHPLFVLLHGMGGSETDLIPLARELDSRAGYLALRGQVLEDGRIRRFFKRVGPGVFDQADLLERTLQLNAFLQWAVTNYHVQWTDLILIGYSNGANFAASLLFRHQFKGRGVMLLHPMVPTRGLIRPMQEGLQIFISAGINDPICPAQESRELNELLREQHAIVTLHWSHQGHSLTSSTLSAARQWLSSLQTK